MPPVKTVKSKTVLIIFKYLPFVFKLSNSNKSAKESEIYVQVKYLRGTPFKKVQLEIIIAPKRITASKRKNNIIILAVLLILTFLI